MRPCRTPYLSRIATGIALIVAAGSATHAGIVNVHPMQYSFAGNPARYYGAFVLLSGGFAAGETVKVTSPNQWFTGYYNGPLSFSYLPTDNFAAFKSEIEGGSWTVTRTLDGVETTDTFSITAPSLTVDLFGSIAITSPAPGATVSSLSPGQATWNGPAGAHFDQATLYLFPPSGSAWTLSPIGDSIDLPFGLPPGEYDLGLVFADTDSSVLEFSRTSANEVDLANGSLYSQHYSTFTVVPEASTVGVATAAVLSLLAGSRVFRRAVPRRSARLAPVSEGFR